MLQLPQTGTANVRRTNTSNPDAELIAAGKAFEPLLMKYLDGHVEWARLGRATNAAVDAKFPNHEWEGGLADDPKWSYHAEVAKKNGYHAIGNKQLRLCSKMRPLADIIDEAAPTTVEGMRAVALVAIWECVPLSVDSSEPNFDDNHSHEALFKAVVSLTGLSAVVTGNRARFKALERGASAMQIA